MPSRSAWPRSSCAWRAVALPDVPPESFPASPGRLASVSGRVSTSCWDSSHWVGALRKWQSALRGKPQPIVDLLPRRKPPLGRDAQRTVTGIVAFRDTGPCIRGLRVLDTRIRPRRDQSHRGERLPFGKDEKQAETYDDWSVEPSRTTGGEQPPNTEGEGRRRGFRTSTLLDHQRRAAHAAAGHRPG